MVYAYFWLIRRYKFLPVLNFKKLIVYDFQIKLNQFDLQTVMSATKDLINKTVTSALSKAVSSLQEETAPTLGVSKK